MERQQNTSESCDIGTTGHSVSPLDSGSVDERVLTPMPRNTLTAFEPVTLPMEASAY